MTSKPTLEPEPQDWMQDECESCGAMGEGVHLHEYEDEGDPSVGYGPIIEVLCDECADKKFVGR